MERYIIFKDKNGMRAAHGTALILSDDMIVTSHALDANLGSPYHISYVGVPDESIPLSVVREIVIPAPGASSESVSPYVYQVTIG